MHRAIKLILSLLHFCTSTLLLLMSLGILTFLWWKLVALWYLTLPHPIGGDYYNGLTYVVHLMRHLPLPPQGWLTFWNEGVPIIGGYPWVTFYLMAGLAKWFTPAIAMNLVSLIFLLFFIISAHLLYLQISKNHLVAITLSLVTFASQAPYFQLMSGGFFVGSAMQFFLPLSLFFMFRFLESRKRVSSLALSGGAAGLAILHHLGLGVLFVAVPTIAIFVSHLLLHRITWKDRGKSILLLGFFVTGLGSMSLFFYSKFTADPCNNPQCWGIYPYHIRLWMGYTPIGITLAWLLITILFMLIKYIKRAATYLNNLLPPLMGLIVVLLYPITAYLQLINTYSNPLFPRRMFWAILVLLLAVSAQCFRIVTQKRKILSAIVSLVFFALTIPFIQLRITLPFDISLKQTFPQTMPNIEPTTAEQWLIPKYQNSSFTDHYPEWLLSQNPQYRIDSQNILITHWLNIATDIPSTRGYTSSFNPSQNAWVYYLQTALSNNQPKDIPLNLIKNRALFLFDAYGIGYIVSDLYHPLILEDTRLFANTAERFRQIKPEFTSPIINPINSIPILFIGDDAGYEIFIRILALINFNSRRLIPVRGPMQLSSLTEEKLAQFPVLFLYGYEDNLDKLESYVKNGGKLFLELTSLKKLPDNLAPLLPYTSVSEFTQSKWDAKTNHETDIMNQIDPRLFAPLSYHSEPWKMVSLDKVEASTEILLWQHQKPVLARSHLEKGTVFISGLNFPFHIIEYNNEMEIKLFTKILEELIPQETDLSPIATISREVPEKILVRGTNYTGIYFKENYHPGWKAWHNDKPVPIYKAGLNFMYILTDATQGTTIIKFQGSLLSWVLFGITIFTILSMLLIIISPKLFSRLFKNLIHPLKKLFHKPMQYMRQEEHYHY